MSGRSNGVNTPGGAATTAGIALIAGIAVAEKLLTEVFEEVTLALTKHHGRVFMACRPRRAGLIGGDVIDAPTED